MPRDLPGLYWDENKNRYFPLSSKPNYPSPPSGLEERALIRPLPSRNASEEPSLKRRRVETSGTGQSMWTSLQKLQTLPLSTQRNRCIHDIMSFNIMATSHGDSYNVAEFNGDVTAFSVMSDTHYGGTFSALIGDSHGWLHAFRDIGNEVTSIREMSLGSRISAVSRSGRLCVALSFGSPPRILIEEDDPTEIFRVNVYPKHVCFDVWDAHLRGRKLLIGAGTKALFYSDVLQGGAGRSLGSHSGVFTVYQQDENIMYGGTRSGSVCRWDIREASNNNILIPPSSGFGSITHVSTIREWQLLVSTIFGDLKTYDLRFMRPVRPLMHFAGHNNQYIVKLGITVDPRQDFVFAGGQDCRIRAWSLRSGESLQLPPISSAALENNPFLRTFSDPVVAMHITESDKGICLWAASGGTLHRYHLGQHSGGSS